MNLEMCEGIDNINKELNLNDVLKEICVATLHNIGERNNAGKLIGITVSNTENNEMFTVIYEKCTIQVHKRTLKPVGVRHIFKL